MGVTDRVVEIRVLQGATPAGVPASGPTSVGTNSSSESGSMLGAAAPLPGPGGGGDPDPSPCGARICPIIA
jgi:hypothetical protein